uniref:CSON005257 protein n=1 Tax=Culicoides sonorensis TaxID=179676 RepID=A0A336K1W8_CULSO
MDYLLFIVKELQKSGRVRQNTHRWTRAQTDKLLEMVFAETEGDPNKYEKPTHQIFYKKILEKNNDELFGLTWTLLDNKMRNLRTQYLKAIEWLKNTGSGLQSEGKHKSISEYISKICPFYDKLHDIFAEKRSINTVNVVESSSIDSDALMQLLDSEGDSQQPYVIEDDPSFHLDGSYSETSVIVSGEQNDHLSQESCSIQQNDHLFQELANNYQQNTTSTSTTSVMSPIIPNFLSPSETEPQRSQKKRRVGQGGSLNTLVELQEKRLKLEELKMQSEIELHDILIKTRGQSVTLECPLDVKACGELHSEMIELQLLSIDHSPLGPSTRLHIKSLQVSDDDSYLCESTYLEPLESCDNTGAYNIKLNIYVPPSSIVMLDESGHLIRNGTKTKPLREGETLTKSCEAIGARPTPKIGWYKNGKRLQDTVTAEEIDGLYTVKSKFSLLLTRGEVQGQLECLVETPALESMVSNFLLLDMEIRPTSIDLSGVEHHVVKGTKVLLQCEVKGARPAANVTFYNNSQIVTDGNKGISISTIVEEKKDGTFETVSQMIFTATRFENGASIRCEADNIVMRDDGERPLHDTLVLEVMYPPVVNVRPNNITTNETESFLLFCEYDANPASLERVTWLKNGEILNTNQSRYEGGHPEQTALLVKNALRSDIGTYICELQNSIGSDASDNKINVDIQYVPTVEIDMEPDSPLIENNESNVTLYCNVLQGNPLALLKVRWFLDGQLLKELPECEDDVNDEDSLCEIDPSKMLLQNVGRDFHGNYSCEGFNAAGWGDVSNEAELLVHYEPGNASLAFYPPIPVKRKSVTFTCSVDDPGNPSATRYRWLRGNKPVMDVVTSQWTVDPVGLDSRTNFSCYAYNEGGDAPPAFIQKLHPYTGALFSAKNASLTCRVECVPTCSITWFKDGNGIEKSDTHYSIKETLLPADPSTGDFESVLSILYFNITAWQNEKLDIFKDNANYSCVSTHNSVGTGVRNPPENVTVWSSDTGKSEIMVEEGQMPQRILCSAKAYPEPSYIWIRNDEVIAKGNALIVNKPMQHADAGIYSCIAKNKHGNGTAEANINIRFKPNCTIARKEVDDDDGLVCSAIGNPSNIDFVWSLKPENETLDSSNVKQTSSLVAKVGSHYIVFIDRSTYSFTRPCDNNHDKLYAPGALTEPGEYENLPFHGLQTAPNKSACLTTTNSNNTNVVRVAPRQKFQVTNQSSLSSSSSHNISSSSQFPIQSFNYINYQSHLIPNTIIYDKNQSSKNPFLVKGGLNKCSDNKFNTLTKSSPTRKSPQFYSMRKCKRHHSYCSPKSNDKVGKLGITSENDNKPNLSFIDYEQPVYENLTDSIQIHEAKLPVNEASSTDSKSGIIRFNNNYNFHHSNDQTIGSSKDRMSIHKSDSGISNSSYEYLPQPAPRINSRTDNSKRDIFENDISNMNAPIYMNLSQNNSFYTRPSNFLPKELFPSSSAILRKESTCSNKSLRRPIKLPLRKHHSFHFQSSQTVTGLVKQRRQQHQHQLQRFNSKEEVNISPISSAINLNIDNNDIINWDDGEIIFKPYDKNSAFKPIQPVNHQLNKYIPNSVDSDLISYTSESYNFDRNNREYLDKNNSISSGSDAKSSSTSSNSSNDRGKLPRICGTSLKRHLIDSNNMSTAESKRKDDLDTTLYHGISENIANSIPKPSRSQYATIKFPEPLSGIDLADDIIYADLNENENYGPINYKAASIYALVKKGKSGELKETTANKKQEFLRINEHSTSPLLNLN